MRLTDCLTDSLLREKIIADEDKEIVRFGLESMEGNLLGIILTLTVGTIFRHIGDALLLWICLFPLRKNAGGFHASTRTRCLLISAGMLVLSFILFAVTEHTRTFYGINAIISGCIIWILAPLGNQNKELDGLEYRKYRRRSRIILVAEGVIYLSAIYFQWSIVLRSIGMTFFIVSMSLIMGAMKLLDIKRFQFPKHIKKRGNACNGEDVNISKGGQSIGKSKLKRY